MGEKPPIQEDPAALLALAAPGAFDPIDRAFAGFIARRLPSALRAVVWGAALASRATRAGHSCLDLEAAAGFPVSPAEGAPTLPELDAWTAALNAAVSVVGKPGDWKPLVLAGRRLYLRRLWAAEQSVAASLRALAARAPLNPPVAADFRAVFGSPAGREPDWQAVAAFSVAVQGLTIITGGPGVGKTWTVAQALRLTALNPQIRVEVAAPTGKAAARLQEALARALPRSNSRPSPSVRTLHRLLGASSDGQRFRHDRSRPLAADLVVVDEASMVDLVLIGRLLDALPAGARLVLVGDPNQLPSVEAGATLADLCAAGAPNQFSDTFRAGFTAASGFPLRTQPPSGALGGCAVQLQRNYRFGGESGIDLLRQRLLAGDAEGAQSLLISGVPGLSFRPLPPPAQINETLLKSALPRLAAGFAAAEPAAALRALGDFRVLAAVREGPFGVAAVNAAVAAGRSPAARSRWTNGTPILVTANDYSLALFNGDLGVVAPEPAGRLAAWFLDPDGAPRSIPLALLPNCEPAYGMTIHKSQGSEFDHVLVLLPAPASPSDRDAFWRGPGRLLTRELIYTAVTRARRQLEIWADPEVFATTVRRRIRRASGLAEALEAPPGSPGFPEARKTVE